MFGRDRHLLKKRGKVRKFPNTGRQEQVSTIFEWVQMHTFCLLGNNRWGHDGS